MDTGRESCWKQEDLTKMCILHQESLTLRTEVTRSSLSPHSPCPSSQLLTGRPEDSFKEKLNSIRTHLTNKPFQEIKRSLDDPTRVCYSGLLLSMREQPSIFRPWGNSLILINEIFRKRKTLKGIEEYKSTEVGQGECWSKLIFSYIFFIK